MRPFAKVRIFVLQARKYAERKPLKQSITENRESQKDVLVKYILHSFSE